MNTTRIIKSTYPETVRIFTITNVAEPLPFAKFLCMQLRRLFLTGLVAFAFILGLFQPSCGQESPIYKWALKVTSQTCYGGNNIPPLTQSDAAGNVYVLGDFRPAETNF